MDPPSRSLFELISGVGGDGGGSGEGICRCWFVVGALCGDGGNSKKFFTFMGASRGKGGIITYGE